MDRTPFTSRSNRNHQASGFTLVELMVAISVAAIILAAAMPAYSSLLHKNRIRAATNQLFVSLSTARGEAVKRREPVRVCPSADGISCRTDAVWSSGWLIFDNADDNGSPASSEIIRLVDSLHSGVDIQVDTQMAGYVEFKPTGIADRCTIAGVCGATTNDLAFRICHTDSIVYSKAISISSTGRVIFADRTQTDCS